MTKPKAPKGRVDVERRGPVLIARIDGGKLAEFGPEIADALAGLVKRADTDPTVRVVVLTGTHSGRFVSHATIPWLNDGGRSGFPVGRAGSMLLARVAGVLRRIPGIWPLISWLPFAGAVQLDRLHATFLRMNRSSVIFVAALNGSAQGIGSELVQACDVRVMADDARFFIGQFEVLIGFNPGGGGTQRMARLMGPQRALRVMLEGRPVHPREALEIGLVDELVPPPQLLERAVALGTYLGLRPRDAVAAIKRCVHVAARLPLKDGLRHERAEFLSLLTRREAQSLMTGYVAATERDGELPLYTPRSYARALAEGSFPRHGG
ncbi:enoyl-CoA hydratase/isomerase family protein [Niveispirillum sp. KHB5.9]|uniref:enoyl-CoA hydratase/isomerase family protein n=1 Tax=Niveispirillum sp. KHB5.9 TaxID=3400269 RepID=UPI003A84C1DC